jgi:methionyl-tRNA formyltransferase
MRIAIAGQKDFGKAAFQAFIDAGIDVAGVFCGPEKAAETPDPLRLAAQSRGVPVIALPSLRGAQAHQALESLDVDLLVLAYVLQFIPEHFANVPRYGAIQFHPSLLPRYRGPSSINWPIILGDTQTGVSVFRPTDGLDEGPIILQKHTSIGADETVGEVYFGRLFPMGIAALLEAADLIASGRAQPRPQDESLASYEGWCKDEGAKVNWYAHLGHTYNLIRGCDPAPGAWSSFQGMKVRLYSARKHSARTFGEIRGAIGAVTYIGDRSIMIAAQGGQIEISKLRFDGGKKLSAPQFCAQAGIGIGVILGD